MLCRTNFKEHILPSVPRVLKISQLPLPLTLLAHLAQKIQIEFTLNDENSNDIDVINLSSTEEKNQQ